MEPQSAASQEPDRPRSSGRRKIFRIVCLLLWASVIAAQIAGTVVAPSMTKVLVSSGFVLLFGLVNAQLFLAQWMGHRSWRRAVNRLHGSTYLSESHDLPNRNYLLSELRREMPRARTTSSTFVLLLISFDTLDEVQERRGEDYVKRAVTALVDVLKRVTRTSDFICHLDGARFCVMLNECTAEQAWLYLRRVPGSIAVSDGHQMYDVPVSARLLEYDMEALYATDVLRDVEEKPPLRRKNDTRFGAQAA